MQGDGSPELISAMQPCFIRILVVVLGNIFLRLYVSDVACLCCIGLSKLSESTRHGKSVLIVHNLILGTDRELGNVCEEATLAFAVLAGHSTISSSRTGIVVLVMEVEIWPTSLLRGQLDVHQCLLVHRTTEHRIVRFLLHLLSLRKVLCSI